MRQYQLRLDVYYLIKALLSIENCHLHFEFINVIFDRFIEDNLIPELMDTRNLRDPIHKLAFLFFNSEVLNENDHNTQIRNGR